MIIKNIIPHKTLFYSHCGWRQERFLIFTVSLNIISSNITGFLPHFLLYGSLPLTYASFNNQSESIICLIFPHTRSDHLSLTEDGSRYAPAVGTYFMVCYYGSFKTIMILLEYLTQIILKMNEDYQDAGP